MPNLLPSTAIIVTTERSNCMDYIALFIYFIPGDSQRYVCHNSCKCAHFFPQRCVCTTSLLLLPKLLNDVIIREANGWCPRRQLDAAIKTGTFLNMPMHWCFVGWHRLSLVTWWQVYYTVNAMHTIHIMIIAWTIPPRLYSCDLGTFCHAGRHAERLISWRACASRHSENLIKGKISEADITHVKAQGY